MDWESLEDLPREIERPLVSDEQVNKWLHDKRRRYLLDPFHAYTQFIANYTRQNQPDYASVVRLEISGKQIALLGLNSAWMCGRKNIQGELYDYGCAIVGEPQIHDPLEQISNADIRIAVLHHTFDWLAPFDCDRVEDQLGRAALKNTPTPGSEQIQATPLASRRLEAGRNPLTQPRGPRG
jgi:hypothetical protein